jgi:hypothetical protein
MPTHGRSAHRAVTTCFQLQLVLSFVYSISSLLHFLSSVSLFSGHAVSCVTFTQEIRKKERKEEKRGGRKGGEKKRETDASVELSPCRFLRCET